MANKLLHSNSVNVIDITDSRNLSVQLTSNHPTTQIYNVNNNTYVPSWSANNKLTIVPTVFLDSAVVNDSNVNITWQRKDNVNTSTTTLSTTLSNGQQVVGKNLQVSQNVLNNVQIITYICNVTYDGLTASAQITFNRADSGQNGQNITILGTASSVSAVSNTNYYTVDNITNASMGDCWIYNGNLYMCSITNSSGADYFVNLGNIQGPAGDDAKNILLSTNSHVFKVENNTVTPSTIIITGNGINTTITSWQYAINGGEFSTSLPTGVSRTNNIVSINGALFTGNILTIKATDGEVYGTLTIYKISNGEQGVDGEPAPIIFLSNDNFVFNANSYGQIGFSTLSTNIVAYKGLEPVAPQIGTISGLLDGMTTSVNQVAGSREQTLTLSIANNTTLQGNKGQLVIQVVLPYYKQAMAYDEDVVYYADVYGSALTTQPTSTNFAQNTYYQIDDTRTGIIRSIKLYWNKIVNGNDAYTIELSSDAFLVACDQNNNIITGELGSTGKAKCDIIVYKGSTALTSVSGTSPSNGQFSYVINSVLGGTASRIDNANFYLNTVTADSGYISITIYLENSTTTVLKRINFSKTYINPAAADYIVEEDTDDIWTYRKWANGVAECWGTESFTINGWEQLGAIYQAINNVSITYPEDLFIEAPIVNAMINNINTDIIGINAVYSEEPISEQQFYILKCTDTDLSININIDFQIKGYWKER